jgi:hypothetical protein
MDPVTALVTLAWLVLVTLNSGCGKVEPSPKTEAPVSRQAQVDAVATSIRSWASVCKGEASSVLWMKYAPVTKPSDTYQWSFERTDSNEAWRKSMGWEFVALANLLRR